jgi:hypothetical protein
MTRLEDLNGAAYPPLGADEASGATGGTHWTYVGKCDLGDGQLQGDWYPEPEAF